MHLTIDVPLKPFFQGSLNEPATAESWNSRFKSRLDYASLEESGLKLIVAAIYVNPLWGNVEEQVDIQMQSLQRFCQLHTQWRIVSEASQARAEIKKGNKVFLISLEGAWFYGHRELFDLLLTKYPIRIVTPLHFSDFAKKIGRPAVQRGFVGFLRKIADVLFPDETPLTPLGADLIKYLIDRKIWIDLSHASSEMVESFLKSRPSKYPILVTHTVLRRYYGTDRGVTSSLLQMVSDEGGVVGILPSEDMLIDTPTSAQECEKTNPFLVQWKEAVERAGAKNIFLGSDLNSILVGLRPTKKSAACPNPFLPDGLATAADLKEISELQDPNSVENFLHQWGRVRP